MKPIFCGVTVIDMEESLDLRYLVQDDVGYRELDSSVIDKAIRYIKKQ